MDQPVLVAPSAPFATQYQGVNIHGSKAMDDLPERLERLCRYMARPPVCQERLEIQDDG